MIINNHRKHSDFALRHFIAGSCYTPDAAYCLLYAQKEQIEMDLAAGDAAKLVHEAKIEDFEKRINEATTKLEKLEIEAELLKYKASQNTFLKNYEGAKRELETINALLEELKPQCKYWNEDILQMEQDMQREEWAMELKYRGENMILANALGIGYDHLQTMRQHPDFLTEIAPHLEKTTRLIHDARVNALPLEKLFAAPLLEHKES